ncbi:MAG: hypothetical protein ACFFCD_09285 [Promethearchaeota archaeon]
MRFILVVLAIFVLFLGMIAYHFGIRLIGEIIVLIGIVLFIIGIIVAKHFQLPFEDNNQ